MRKGLAVATTVFAGLVGSLFLACDSDDSSPAASGNGGTSAAGGGGTSAGSGGTSAAGSGGTSAAGSGGTSAAGSGGTATGGSAGSGGAPAGPVTPLYDRAGPEGELDIQFKDGSSDPNAWLGLFREGDPDESYLVQQTTEGKAEGTLTFSTPADLGNYEVRMFADGTSSTKLGTGKFVVEMPYDLDPSFDGGKVTFDFLSNKKADWVCGLRGLSDGKVIVAGTAKTGDKTSAGWERNEMVVARLLGDGSLDPSFGQSGHARVAMTSHALAGCTAFSIAPDGKIVLGGWAYEPGPASDFVIVRLSADGVLDNSFGTGGIVTTNFKVSVEDPGQWDKVAALAVLDDGRIIASGSVVYTGAGTFSSAAFARYLPSGALDTSFNSTGTMLLEKKSWAETARALVVASDGSFYGGVSDDGSYASNTTRIVRVKADGSLDTSFGDGGLMIETGPSGPDYRRLIQLTPTTSGTLRMLGLMQGTWFVGSYSAQTGAPEGGDPVVGVFGTAGALPAGMIVMPDGKLLVGLSSEPWDGVNSADGNFAMVRHESTGAMDMRFGRLRWKWNEGTAVVGSRVTAVDYTSDGKVLLGGFIDRGGGLFDFDFAILRLVKNPAW